MSITSLTRQTLLATSIVFAASCVLDSAEIDNPLHDADPRLRQAYTADLAKLSDEERAAVSAAGATELIGPDKVYRPPSAEDVPKGTYIYTGYSGSQIIWPARPMSAPFSAAHRHSSTP